MRFSNGAKTALVALTAGIILSACSSESDTDASASASATADAAPNVAAIVADVNTLTGCETFGGVWSGGRVAGADVVAGWQYTCDVDGDGVAETTLSIYNAGADLDADLVTIEAAASDTAIAKGDGFLVVTTDASHLASLVNEDLEVVRELPAA